jgi:hypothetical protein
MTAPLVVDVVILVALLVWLWLSSRALRCRVCLRPFAVFGDTRCRRHRVRGGR